MIAAFRFCLISIAFLYIGFVKNASAQTTKQYTLYFSDKANNSYSLNRPLEFLSQRSLDRRKRQGIELDETDLPVSPKYLCILAKDSLKIIFTSAWQNCVTIQTKDSLFPQKADKYPFVKYSRLVYNKSESGTKTETISQVSNDIYQSSQYGKSFRQLEIHNGQQLHDAGSQGQRMHIAVIDAGFWKVDTLKAFEKLRQRKGILATHDFVTGNDSVYEDATHGMYVLSAITGFLEGKLIGTAPEAKFFLLRTENANSELIAEEFAWIAALEWADSAGADVVNSSLGYSLFDDPGMNHKYADMNGETTPISKAASTAASKGMILVSSAGNSGATPWHYITTPADAKDILTVGAVDSNGKVAKFSSRGPSADGRVKPDVSSVGVQTIVAGAADGEVIGANGTSTAAPVITGLVTCLWQEFPDRSSFEIMDAVRKSAHLYQVPNDSLGYGIPDFAAARDILKARVSQSHSFISRIYPNPFGGSFTVSFYSQKEEKANLYVTDMLGRIVWSEPIMAHSNAMLSATISPKSYLPRGVYLVIIRLSDTTLKAKLIKD
ncbi:MAG: T9SS type A sorting domain-containing protein [Sphingobacteriales bacterium]|nr:MAG: T9SS type A sorting domain-containing protein [Sphingobacteriales bacterium]